MSFYALSALVNFFTSFILGVLVIYKSRSSKNIGFFIFSFCVAFWSLAYFLWQIADTADGALFWCRVLMAGAIFIPVAYLHFVYGLTDEIKKHRKDLVLSYFLFFILFLTDFTPYFISHIEPQLNFKFWPMAGPIYSAFLIIWFFYVIYSTYLLYRKYKNSTGIIRLQIRYVIIGMVVGFLGGSTNYLLWYRIPIPPFANILVSVYVGAIAYSILRYRLMDVRVAARKIFVYSGVGLFVYGIFYLIISFYEKLFHGFYNTAAYTAGIFVAPFFIFLFYAVDKWVKKFANRYLFYSLYNYQDTINRLTDDLTNYLDLDQIINLIVDTIKKTMNLDRAGVLLVNTETKPLHYQIAKVIGFNEKNGISLVQDSFLTQRLEKTKKPLVRDELLLLVKETKTTKQSKILLNLYDNMKHIEASLCLPLISNQKLIGIIVLGSKLSGDAYTKEDLELLNVLSKQAGVAIENGRLYKQVNDFSRTLKQKVDEQTRDLQKTNKELETKNRLNEELLNMKTDFLRVVNHQLNTPLSVMRSAYSMIDEGTFTADKGIEYSKAGLERMSQTIHDFWTAMELEGEKMKMSPEKTDMAGMIEGLIEEKKKMPLAQSRKIEIAMEKPNFKLPLVWCDAKKVTHVASNLLDNAVFYTEKGSVKVSFEKIDKDYLKINVKDTGMGVSEENEKRLFQKFSRGQGATSLHPDGSGLGLYIAKKIIESNEGELTYESEGLGKGSVFSFTLPIYTSQKAEINPMEKMTREPIMMLASLKTKK